MKSLYRLDQFDRVLALRNRDGLPYLLIGGQLSTSGQASMPSANRPSPN